MSLRSGCPMGLRDLELPAAIRSLGRRSRLQLPDACSRVVGGGTSVKIGTNREPQGPNHAMKRSINSTPAYGTVTRSIRYPKRHPQAVYINRSLALIPYFLHFGNTPSFASFARRRTNL